MPNFSDLPPRARARATALRNAADVAHASVSELSSSLRDLRWSRQEVFSHLRGATDRRFSGGRDILTGNEVAAERQRLAELDDEIARVAAIVDEQSEAHASARALTERVEAFLRGLRPEHTLADRPSPPPLRKGEDVRTAIEARRKRVRELQAERAAVEAAPIPSAETKRLAHEQISRLAERGRPDIGTLLAGDEGFKFSTILGLVKVPQVGVGEVAQIDVEGLICWLFGPQIAATINAEIDQQADDEHALTGQQRAARLEQIGRDQLAVERAEVELVEMAREQGLAIQHRGDIDVRALLGIDLTLAAEAA